MSSVDEKRNDRSDDRDDEEREVLDEELPAAPELHPLLRISEQQFLLGLSENNPDHGITVQEKKEIREKMTKFIEENHMTPFYRYLTALHQDKKSTSSPSSSSSSFDVTLSQWPAREESWYTTHDTINTDKLKEFEAKIAEAHENAGDTEVRDAMLNKANYIAATGDYTQAIEQYEKVLEKTVGVASKIDTILQMIRLHLTFHQLAPLKKDIQRAKTLVEEGGDWERKNQLQVYEGVYLLVTRKFTDASRLFLESVATFTTSELMPYSTFVLYACVLALITVDRQTLKEKVLKSPEILSELDNTPHLRSLLFSLYQCNYSEFMTSLSSITPVLARTPYLHNHLSYYLRELRVVAYSQFLSSYKAASLSSMAASFGVSAEFMDRELFRFISAGKINAKIDKVNAVVDTNRPDTRNQAYTNVLKSSDSLLNRLHKLSKVVAL